jgi:hypothetical protein
MAGLDNIYPLTNQHYSYISNEIHYLEKINLFVASSNIVVLLPLCVHNVNTFYWWLSFTCGLASFFMHLTETKHGLPAFCLKSYSFWFLQIDRIVAIFTCLYVLLYIWLYMGIKYPIHSVPILSNIPHPNNQRSSQDIYFIVIFGIIGLLCNVKSEHTKNLEEFVIFHVIWHIIAFVILAML